jgi:hypothetical protein
VDEDVFEKNTSFETFTVSSALWELDGERTGGRGVIILKVRDNEMMLGGFGSLFGM